jgi:hypothetical protein
LESAWKNSATMHAKATTPDWLNGAGGAAWAEDYAMCDAFVFYAAVAHHWRASQRLAGKAFAAWISYSSFSPS